MVPFKTCTYDCIYCQLGRTTAKTTERREWVELDEVLSQLNDKLATKPDYITLSGSGEPTLYSRMGELIAGVRSMTRTPIAVITNGSLLWHEEIRRQLRDVNLVIPSLDAGSPSMFAAVNRPHAGIGFEQMLEGLIAMRQEHRGEYWLEVMLLAGHTAVEREAAQIIECVGRIKPDRVQLNTVTRPPAEDYAASVDRGRMTELAGGFDPPAEVIADYRGIHGDAAFAADQDSILEMIRRRPCSLDDIAAGLNMHRHEVIKTLDHLAAEGLLDKQSVGGETFHVGRPQPDPTHRPQ